MSKQNKVLDSGTHASSLTIDRPAALHFICLCTCSVSSSPRPTSTRNRSSLSSCPTSALPPPARRTASSSPWQRTSTTMTWQVDYVCFQTVHFSVSKTSSNLSLKWNFKDQNFFFTCLPRICITWEMSTFKIAALAPKT